MIIITMQIFAIVIKIITQPVSSKLSPRGLRAVSFALVAGGVRNSYYYYYYYYEYYILCLVVVLVVSVL